MKIIELDFTGCKYLYEIHERIQTAFCFDDGYGRNWNAFWDLLWSECDADRVDITGEDGLPENLKNDLEKMHEVLDDNIAFRKDHNLSDFSYQIIN